MEKFFLIISLVVAVLNIFLFFKIWIMTNDVRKIKGHLESSVSDNLLDVKFAYLKGDEAKTKELILDAFIKELITTKWDVQRRYWGGEKVERLKKEYDYIQNKYDKLCDKYGFDHLDYTKYDMDAIPDNPAKWNA